MAYFFGATLYIVRSRSTSGKLVCKPCYKYYFVKNNLLKKAFFGPRTAALVTVNILSCGYQLTDAFNGFAMALRDKKAVLPQGNRAMPQVFFSVEVRQQHSLQV